MKRIESDVIIIGSGAAGLLTSINLAKKGKRVTVLSKGFGATAMSSGCFDILGYSYENYAPLSSFREGYDVLPDGHPYKILSDGSLNKLETILKAAVQEHPEIFNDFLVGRYDKNVLVINLFGTIKPTSYVQRSMRHAILEEDNCYLFLGFKEFYDYNPALQASMLKTSLRVMRLYDIKVDYANMSLGRYAKIPYIQFLNNLLKDLKFRKEFISNLRSIVENKKCNIVLLPAIFHGVKDLEEIASNDFIISEVPSPPPYRAGLRFNEYLVTLAKNLGGRIYYIKNIKPHVIEKNIVSIEALVGEKLIEFIADTYVLATGDFIGGGLKVLMGEHFSKRVIIDTVFNTKLGEESINELVSNDVFETHKHKVAEFGFKINSQGKPVDEKGNELFGNLFVAGSIMGGYNYLFEKSGLGITLITSYIVSKEILRSRLRG